MMFVLLRLSSLFLYERSENTKGDLYHAIVDCLFSKLDMYFAMDLGFLSFSKKGGLRSVESGGRVMSKY